MKILYAIFLFLIIFSYSSAEERKLPGPFLYGENITREIGNWKIVDKDNKSLAYVYEKNKPKDYPRLHIDCVYSEASEKSYRLYLDSATELQLLKPEWVELMIIIDEDNRMPIGWHPYDGKRLVSNRYRYVLENMIEGIQANLIYRDKVGLNDYYYELDGLGEVLAYMETVCGFGYTYKEDKKKKEGVLNAQLDNYAKDVNRNLPRLIAGTDGVIFYKLQRSFTVLEHVFILKDKRNEDITLDGMDEVMETSKLIGSEFCSEVQDKESKHHDLFSKNNIPNRFIFVDKDGVFVYVDGINCSS